MEKLILNQCKNGRENYCNPMVDMKKLVISVYVGEGDIPARDSLQHERHFGNRRI